MAQYITMNDFFENPNEYKSKFGVGICRVIQRKFELEPEQISLFEDIFQIEFDDQKNKNQTVLLYVEPDIEDLDELIMIMSREIKIRICVQFVEFRTNLILNFIGVVRNNEDICYYTQQKNNELLQTSIQTLSKTEYLFQLMQFTTNNNIQLKSNSNSDISNQKLDTKKDKNLSNQENNLQLKSSTHITTDPEYITMDKYFAEPHLHNNQFGVVYCYVLKEKNELGPKFTMRPENIYQVDFDELKNKNQHVMIFSDSNDNNIQALASKIGTKEKIRICIQLSEVRGLFCFRFVGIIKNESDIEQFIKPKVSEDQESINSIEKDNDNKLSSSLPPPPDSPQTPSSFHSPGTSLGRPGTGFIDHSESDSGSTSNATLSSSSKSPPPLLSPHSLYHPSDCNEFFKFLTEYTAQDGISFSKGEIVRVIKKEVDWFTFEKDGNKRRISSGKLIQCTFGEQLNRKSYENFEQQRRKALEEDQKRKALEEEQKRKARKEQKRKNQLKKDKKLQEKQTRKTLEDEQKRISLEEEQLSEEMFFKVVTHQLLNEVMKGDNDNYQCDENSPFVSERVPTIAVRQYIERAIKYMCCRRDCYLYACIYITHYLTRTGTRLCSRNFHRLFVICLSLSAKFIGDHYYRNSYYAQVAGITVAEFNSLELEFLFKIDFALLIEVESYRLFHRNFMRGIALIDLMRFIDERYHRLNGPNATVAENTPLLQMHIQNLQAPIQLTPAQTNLQSSSPPILLQQNTDQFQQTRPQLQLQTQTQQTLQQQSQLTTLNIQQKQPQSSLQQRFTDDGSAVDMLGSSGRMSRGSNISVSDRSSILGRRIQSLDSSINSNGPNTQGTNFSIVTGDIASLIEQPESVISSLAYQYSSPTSQPDIFTQTVQNPSTIILEPAVYKEMLQKQQEKEKEKERGRKERDREEEKENRRNQTGRHSYDGRMSASATSEKSSTSSFTSPTTSSFHSHGTSLGRSGTGFIDNSEPDSGSTSKATIQYSSKSPPPLLSPHSLQNSSDCNEFFKFLSEYSAQDGISFSKGEIVRVIKKEVDWFTFEKDGNKRRIPSGKLIQCTFGEQLNRKSDENFEQQKRNALKEKQKIKTLEDEQFSQQIPKSNIQFDQIDLNSSIFPQLSLNSSQQSISIIQPPFSSINLPLFNPIFPNFSLNSSPIITPNKNIEESEQVWMRLNNKYQNIQKEIVIQGDLERDRERLKMTDPLIQRSASAKLYDRRHKEKTIETQKDEFGQHSNKTEKEQLNKENEKEKQKKKIKNKQNIVQRQNSKRRRREQEESDLEEERNQMEKDLERDKDKQMNRKIKKNEQEKDFSDSERETDYGSIDNSSSKQGQGRKKKEKERQKNKEKEKQRQLEKSGKAQQKNRKQTNESERKIDEDDNDPDSEYEKFIYGMKRNLRKLKEKPNEKEKQKKKDKKKLQITKSKDQTKENDRSKKKNISQSNLKKSRQHQRKDVINNSIKPDNDKNDMQYNELNETVFISSASDHSKNESTIVLFVEGESLLHEKKNGSEKEREDEKW